MTASRWLLFGETSHMHCSGVILAHSSTQTQTVFKCWRFRGPLLWSLVLSVDFLMDSSQLIGWAILAALFSLSNQLRVALAVFCIIVLLKCPLFFHLHHCGRCWDWTTLTLISTDKEQDCFLTDWLKFPCFFLHPPFLHVLNTFHCVIPFYDT